ncbi:MAG: soluble methane monooxygenase-binding protein MmoD [Methylococcales bacterium]|nr:soluble methane monooxygenase-binding protein MmoD [Methylococcales bacterium]
MSEHYQQPTQNISSLFSKNEELTKLYDDETYTAYTEDLEFMWRWTIYRENELVQEGCSLTEDASRHAVNHVMAFFNASKKNEQTEIIETGES